MLKIIFLISVVEASFGFVLLQAEPASTSGPFWTWGPVALIASALTLMSTGLVVVPRWVYNASEERNNALTAENKRLTRKIEWMALNYPALLRDVAKTPPTPLTPPPDEEEEDV